MIADNLNTTQKTIPEGVKLVAVSKNNSVERVFEAYQAGQRVFGENRVQELVAKQEILPKDIEWHLIGHLQTNKVKYIAPFVSLIHSIDSLRLLEEVNKEAKKNNRIIDVLLQFHVAQEETKFGLTLEEAADMLLSEKYASLLNIRIVGIMGMASNVVDDSQIRLEFRELKQHFDFLKQKFFSEQIFFQELSMGMSSDYQIAIKEGSTIVRVGSKIFQ